jgi:hypothetical protein
MEESLGLDRQLPKRFTQPAGIMHVKTGETAIVFLAVSANLEQQEITLALAFPILFYHRNYC